MLKGLSNLLEIFCEIDDFCNATDLLIQTLLLLTDGKYSAPRGPECGLVNSEIMTILVLYHMSGFKHFKIFYEAIILKSLRAEFPQAPSYARFIVLTKRAWMPLTMFMASKFGKKTGLYYIDTSKLAVCDNRRINRHKVFRALAERGKTTMGWFFGFKLHIVFNDLREIVAVRITPGNVDDRKPVRELTKDLVGKLFGDKGYIGKELAQDLLKRGLVLMTRVKKNMKSLPMSMVDKALLNGRNIVETIIGHIKEYSSLRLPKHRSVPNAMTHLIAALVAYQINPLTPAPMPIALPQ